LALPADPPPSGCDTWQDANIIFGTSVDESFDDEISVTVVATSFDVPGPQPTAKAAQPPITVVQAQPPPPPQDMPPDQPRWGGSPDPYAPPAPDTRKPRFWGRF
jgi:hypothetical protein